MLTLILTPPKPGTDDGLGATRFDALLDALTAPQRAAVGAALRCFADQHPDTSLARAARTALAAW